MRTSTVQWFLDAWAMKQVTGSNRWLHARGTRWTIYTGIFYFKTETTFYFLEAITYNKRLHSISLVNSTSLWNLQTFFLLFNTEKFTSIIDKLTLEK